MNIKKSVLTRVLSAFMIISLLISMISIEIQAASIPVYHKIPPYQQKEFYETETITIQGLPVEEVVNSTVSPVITRRIEKDIKFIIFNSTKQEIEQEVTSKDGTLPDLALIKNHNYIIFAEDSEYRMSNVYIWVKDNQIVNIKDMEAANYTYNYPEIRGLRLYKRINPIENPESDNRVSVNLPVRYGESNIANMNFKFVSDVETITGNTGSDGKLEVSLLEDVTYIVMAESEEYAVESFPIAVKDKSEYGEGKFTYDHSDCHRVDEIQLVKKEDAHKNDTEVTSLSGDITVTGANFKDILVIDKKLDNSLVQDLSGKDYEVIDIKAVNPHRWEISKFAAGEFKITKAISGKRAVENIYYIDKEGKLQKIDFEQIEGKVNFTMNSLSLYPVVIVYAAAQTSHTTENVKVTKISISGISKKIAAGKTVQLTAQIAPSNVSDKNVKWTTSNKKYATVNSKGKVTLKKAGAGKTVKITAAATDGSGKKAVYQIKIMKNAVKSIILKGKSSVKAGKKITVKATVKATGKTANKKLKWTSSNTKYATVNSKGKVTAKKAGAGKTVKITARATDGSGKKKTIKIKIK